MAADNASSCSLTDIEITNINLVYSGLSFCSLIIGLISVILERCFYRSKHQSDPIGEIFFFILIVGCSFEFCESFQWFLLVKDFAGCTVLGVVREYIIVSLMVLVTCLGTHLLILISQPKCLQVITEVRQRRYKYLLRVYFIAAYLVPFLLVPWPLIKMDYGSDETICWITYIHDCNASDLSNILINTFMLHLGIILVWTFTTVVVLLAVCRCCIYRRSFVTRCGHTANVSVIITLMIVFFTQGIVNGTYFLWDMIKIQSSFSVSILAAILTPLSISVYYMALIVRKVRIIHARLEDRQWASERNLSTHNMTSHGATTHFNFPDESIARDSVQTINLIT